MYMNELKPCPFCGGEVSLVPEGDYHEIVCDDCQVSMQWRSADVLADCWNTRYADKEER